MKELKYVKLFEAFESSKLSSTLNFLNKDSRGIFLKKVKQICSLIDLPESKLSDDLFEYLPYAKAIKHNGNVNTISDIKCPAEDCIDGKIPGVGNRRKICRNCKGTDRVEVPAKASTLSLIKFWFDINGALITTTGVDGIYRGSNVGKLPEFSKDLNDYEIGARIPKTRMKDELKTGDMVKFTMTRKDLNNSIVVVSTDVIGYIYKEDIYNRNVFALQEIAGSDYPSYGSSYRNNIESYSDIGSKCWIFNNNGVKDINILKLKNPIISSKDPLGYNTILKDDLRVTDTGIKDSIKAANFAIILDLNKLNDKEFTVKSSIKDEREESKKGATYLLKDVDIKTVNIQRYFKAIFDRTKFNGDSGDILNYSKVINRLLTGKYCVYILNKYGIDGLTERTPNSMATKILDMMKKINNNESYVNSEDFTIDLDRLNSTYSAGINNRKLLNDNISKYLKEYNIEQEQLYNLDMDKIVKLIEILSIEITDYFNSIVCETIEDIEILLQEVVTIRRILDNDRSGFGYISEFLSAITGHNWRSGDLYNKLKRSEDTNKDTIENLEQVIRIIKRKRERNK